MLSHRSGMTRQGLASDFDETFQEVELQRIEPSDILDDDSLPQNCPHLFSQEPRRGIGAPCSILPVI
jgi:hypothetical protein